MPKKITSLSNSNIKDIVRLKEKRHRDQTGLTIVDGAREIKMALAAGVRVEECYFAAKLLKNAESKGLLTELEKSGAILIEITPEIYRKIAYGEREEGILAVCSLKPYTKGELRLSDNPFVLIIEDVEKPGNLGAILRSADAAGVDGVIVCDQKADLWNSNVIRASLGTVFSIKPAVMTKEEAVEFLKGNKIEIYAATPQARKYYTEVNFKIPMALVVGSEDEGLSSFWLKAANEQIKIPMHGKIDSLNVSASTAILLYEVLRQRKK